MSEQRTEARTCRFPGCTRPAMPAAAETGRPPEYCEDPAHNRAAAWRARQRLQGAEGVDEALPVDAARQRASEISGQVTGMMEHLGAQLTTLIEELRTVSDPEAVEAQLESMSTEAAEKIAAANARATRAGQAQRRAEAERAEADAAAEDATRRSESLAADLDQSRADAATASEANARLAEELTQASDAAQEAQRRAEAEIERLNSRLDETEERAIRAGQDRDEALARAEASELARATAEERARSAEQRLAAEARRATSAESDTATMREELATGRAEAERIREAAAELRGATATLTAQLDAARGEAERERAYGEQRVQDLRINYDRQVDQLREELAQLRGEPGRRPAAAKSRRGAKDAAPKPAE